MLEPIQGEGGIHPATKEFLDGIKALCEEHDLLLLFDEVQCGFGRTGHLMGWRAFHETIEPDAISWAKGMGGGFPIGGFWLSDRKMAGANSDSISSVLGAGSHGSTYGGNPLASAVSHAVISEVIDQDLCSNVQAREQQIYETVNGWNHPMVKEVRGAGLLIGIALNESTKIPEGLLPSIHMCNVLAEQGMLVPPAGGDVIRLLPPLNVTEDEVAAALTLLKSGLDTLI